MEKIIRIEEGSFKKEGCNYTDYDGYLIITDKQTIKIGIDNSSQCCENWGYFLSHDDLEEFIGAEINGIHVVSTCLNKEKLKDVDCDYGGDTMFVNFETDKGALQFTAYNEHNGYYGHDAIIISEQLNIEECL